MIEEFDAELYSGQKRRATVYVPDMNGNFPVLYMLDGQTVFYDERSAFGKSLKMGEFLDEKKVPLIVAAIDSDGTRMDEYSPFPVSREPFGCMPGIKCAGKGEAFLDALTQNFKRQIDEKYPTYPDRDHTFIAGCSMGGLMAVYALCRYADVFSGGAALSPSFWIDKKASVKMIKNSSLGAGVKLYVDYDEREINAERGDALAACVGELIKKKTSLVFRCVPNGGHDEISWRGSVPVLLKALGVI